MQIFQSKKNSEIQNVSGISSILKKEYLIYIVYTKLYTLKWLKFYELYTRKLLKLFYNKKKKWRLQNQTLTSGTQPGDMREGLLSVLWHNGGKLAMLHFFCHMPIYIRVILLEIHVAAHLATYYHEGSNSGVLKSS